MNAPIPLPERQPKSPQPKHQSDFGDVIIPDGSDGGGSGSGRGPRRGRGGGRGGGEMEDQTPVFPSTPDELGAAIILDIPVGGPSVVSQKRLLFEVTHEETLAEGHAVGALAVKWISPRVASETAMRASRCGNDTIHCEKTCVKPGCICDPIRHFCV